MVESERPEFAEFVQKVVDNLTKHGFPERKVAFPIERMYETAHARGLNFNRVLDALAERGITHEKTPEKVIFWSSAHHSAAPAGNPFAGIDPGALAAMDPSVLQNLSPEQMMAAAAQAMQQMSPEQRQALEAMVGNMTEEQREEMLEQARKMGLL